MAESIFGNCMAQYQPGWEPEPEHDGINHDFDLFHTRITRDHRDYFPTLIELFMLERNGYDITTTDIVDKAFFLAEYRAKSRPSLPDPTYPQPEGQIVYYMRMRDLIKIGTTIRPVEQRRAALLADSVLAVEPGGYQLEKHRHKQFAHLNYQGERFYPGVDLLDHIAMLKGQHDRQTAPDGRPIDGRDSTEPSDGQAA